MERHWHIPVEGLSQKEIENLSRLLNKTQSHEGFVEIDAKNIVERPFEIKIPEDLELPQNFPYCCEYHTETKSGIEQWFEIFPNCCDAHKKLIDKKWFSKNDYKGLPDKILVQLGYTEQHIAKKINDDDWYKDITDYIEYNLDSFGKPSTGQGKYLEILRHYLENSSALNSNLILDRTKELVNYIDAKYNPNLIGEEVDLNVLYRTFQRWVKAIPDLDIFSDFKKNLTNRIPMNLFMYDSEYNPYTNLVRSKAVTQTQLVEILIHNTKKLLEKTSFESLLKSGYGIDFNKHEFSLLTESHKIKQIKLLSDFEGHEIKYVKIIKKWLNNEIEYFEKAKSFLGKENQKMDFDAKKKILFLSANPLDTSVLRLDDEFRKIKDEIQASALRDKFELIWEPSVKINTITKSMQMHTPTIVHFSGHGSGSDGLLVQNDNGDAEYFTTIGLNRLFKLFKNKVKCVLLNACYSKEQAKVISQHNIYVIGMNKAISDKAAIDFARGFYQSIAEGKSVKFAFQIGLVSNSPNLNDSNTPELWRNGKTLKV